MAHMYPEAGPAEDCESSAERKLYHRFRETLGPEFYVLHSRKWNHIAGNGKMQPGEADFVIIHPHLGIAIIEVKGGRITQHPKTGVWYTIDRHDKKSEIKDPYTQAMRSAKVLERKLRDVPATRPFASMYRICYGVWFPDIHWARDGRGALRMTDEQTLDMTDVADPTAGLTRLTRFTLGSAPAAPLPPDALSALLDLLAPDFTTVESPLAGEIGSNDKAIAHLTDEQAARLMAMWSSHRQLAIPGHAGTGKTVIALEMAWRLAETGQRVLFLCANLSLAEYLRQRIHNSPRGRQSIQTDVSVSRSANNLPDIKSLYELVKDIAIRGGLRNTERQNLDVTRATDQTKLASILTANLDILAQRNQEPVYDALIVDEAQDINQPLWTPLRRLLRVSGAGEDTEPTDGVGADATTGMAEPPASLFYVFYDPAQRDLPDEWDPHWTGIGAQYPPLTVNCRNTAAIYDLMATFNPLLRDAPFRGPTGRPVIYRDPNAETGSDTSAGSGQGAIPPARMVDTETATLEQVLNGLIEREGVRPEQIMVVTCRTMAGKNPTRWRLVGQQQLGRRSLEWIRPIRSPQRVALTTIRSSKGLESPVVVLTELDGVAAEDGKHDQLLYTAISRAQHQLIILASPEDVTPTQPGSGWWQRFFKRASPSASISEPKQLPLVGGVATDGARSDVDPFVGPDTSDATIAEAPTKSHRGSTSTQATEAPFTPSPYQEAIFEFVRNGQGDGIVSAVAGSGKTSTLVEAAKQINTRSALFAAFNKHIADHLAHQLRATPMMAKTLHSIGYATIGRYVGSERLAPVDERKYTKLCQAWVDDKLVDLDRAQRRLATTTLRELVDLTRQRLTPPSDGVAMRAMAAHFSVECDALPLSVLIQGVPAVLDDGERLALGELGRDSAEGGAEGGAEDAPCVIDFTDMVYLPHRWNLPARYRVDWMFLDEAQDLNAAQLALAFKCRAPHGRMLFVGDPHQAIYGFSGADSDAFAHIKAVTHAREFALSICYRCPASHVALARELVPEIRPRPDAPQGIIAEVTPGQLPHLVRKGDLIIGRKTAPLVELCIRLLQHGTFAQVSGREIGVHLAVVVQEVTRLPGYTWSRFGQFLGEYQRQQAAKIQQSDDAGAEAELVRFNDRVAAVRVCYELFAAPDAAHLCRKIDEVINDGRPDVVLSTVHKAKGLEADRVFVLEPESMPLRWPNQQAWELEQEHNIKYVALTRAKQELYLVTTPAS